ncbi:hypothetical protein [Paenibacillus sp. sgz500958]
MLVRILRKWDGRTLGKRVLPLLFDEHMIAATYQDGEAVSS